MNIQTAKLATPHLQYRPDIDGLRAIAVLSVVGYHAFPDLVRGGFVGVDVFFVISGFLISTIIFQNLDGNRFSFSDFYARRIKRIFPSLLVVLASCLCFGWIALLPIEYQQLGKHVAGGSGFISNFVLWHESGYFDTAAYTKPLLHLWSLGIEEQFYILWPFVLWLSNRKRAGIFIIALLALISFDLNIRGIHSNSVATFYSPQTRFWELFSGGLLARLLPTRKNLSGIFSLTGPDIVSTIGIVLISLAVLFLTETSLFPGWLALVPVAGTLLVILSGPNSRINRTLLSNRILVWVGLISYPLYLWHVPLLVLARIIERQQPGGMIRVSMVLMSIMLASFTYLFIEKPIRSGKAGNVKVALLLSGMLATGMAGLYILTHDGFPERNKRAEQIREDNWSLFWPKTACADEYLRINRDCVSVRPVAPDVLLIGDSHSQALYMGMKDSAQKAGINVMRLAAYLPFYNVAIYSEGSGLVQDPDEIDRELKFAVKTSSIKAIVMSFRGVFEATNTDYIDKKPVPQNGRVVKLVDDPAESNHERIFEQSLRKTIAMLASSGKEIVFVLDNAEMGFNPVEKCLDLRPFRIQIPVKQPCGISREEFEIRNLQYRRAVQSILEDYPQVYVVDAAEEFCDLKWCWAAKDGLLFYQDDNHLSFAGSRILAQKLEKTLKTVKF